MGYIYQIRNIESNKCYIGQSRQKNEQDRWSQHKHNAFKRKSSRIAIYDAMRSYGIEKFEYTIICRVENDIELNDVERQYIRERNTQVPNGYNITPGGDHNPHSEETKRKIGEKSKGRQTRLGHKCTEEQKKRIGDASRGRKFSDETKQHLSEIHSQRHKENPIPHKNCKYTEDDIRYMRNNPDNLTIDELRNKFNIHRYRLLKIQNKEVYKHVKDLGPV
jgi:group I intron endonuclease